MPLSSEQQKKLNELYRSLAKVRLADENRLRGLVRRIRSAGEGDAGRLLDLLESRITSSIEKASLADRLEYLFPEELPISAKAGEICRCIRENPVTIVCGSTGSGKTTQLPKIALKAGFGRRARIGCTQPRRIAASSLASRVAKELSCECGNEVGYKVRFDDGTGAKTIIKFMTDGILLAETKEDPLLLQYDCIILDEVHERSLNIDFLLGYVKLLLKKRPALRIVISSATLESQRISEFFDHAPVIEVEGRVFPIEDVYLEPEEEEDLSELIARGVEYLNNLDPQGDILVFLPGEREIRDCSAVLEGRRFFNTEILALFGRLSRGDQQRIFAPSRFRRIVLATNVAETSLTIPGIRHVVDSGLARLSRYNPRTRIQELHVEDVSRASVRQRRGRCGRTEEGICVHLYSEEDLASRDEFTPPEIQRSSLAGVILQMAELRLPPLGEFPLVDEPSPALIREGMRTLDDLGAIVRGRITRAGHQLAAIPLDPHLGKMLLEGAARKVLPEMQVICAFLSIPDPRERPFEKAAEADQAHKKFSSKESDYLGILILWHALEEQSSNQLLRKFCQKNYLNFRRIREWRNLTEDLRSGCAEIGLVSEFSIDPEKVNDTALHKTLLSGLPRQIGIYNRETRLFSDMTGKKFLIFPGSGLASRKNPPDAILSFALVETTRVFARCNAVIRPEWLEEIAPQLCAYVYSGEHFDPSTGFVTAKERVTAGALVIHPGRRCNYAKTHPKEAREVFIREALASGEAVLPGTWLEENAYLIRELYQLETKIRRPGSIVDDAAIFDHYDRVLPAYVCSVSDVKKDFQRTKRNYCPDPHEMMQEHARDIREEDYPDHLTFSGFRFPLSYYFDPGEEKDGIFLTVKEDALNLLNPYAMEYLVPGFLAEKTECLLRALPKKRRVELQPVGKCAEDFAEACAAGNVFTEQPFCDALAEWLVRKYDTDIMPDEFDPDDFPEHLVMKLVILNQHNKVERICRKFPDSRKISSCLSRNLPSAGKWNLSKAVAWPDITRDMPLSVTVSKDSETDAYPALVDEPETRTVGRRVFLKLADAKYNHSRALLRLVSLECPSFAKVLSRIPKFSHQLELSFFMDYPDWRLDLAEQSLLESFAADPWLIRSASAWENALSSARDNASGAVARKCALLEKIYDLYAEADHLLHRISSPGTEASVERFLSILFRPGFLKTPKIVGESERSMHSLKIRLERAISSPAKDAAKGAELEPYFNKFEAALNSVSGLEKSEALQEFLYLLCEASINRYTPEIPVRIKCGPPVLAEAWDRLRIS